VEVSAIVPVYNRAAELAQCLAALRGQRGVAMEVVVVDDGSTDDSADVAASLSDRVIRLPRRSGAAVARNEGVRNACADVLLFIDSDVLVAPGTARHALDALAKNPDYDAVFGSYDAVPRADGIVSVFRNLLHHYTHQTADREAVTFWAGCGAMRKSAFERIGGFDAAWEGIEDIELGYRLRDHGHRILLDRDMQVTHTKRWTFGSMVRTDFRARAIPWSRLILARGSAPDALNVRTSQRVSVALALVVALGLMLAPVRPAALWGAAAAWTAVAWLNRDFYAFLARTRGWLACAAGLPLHLTYLLTAGLGYVYARAERALSPAARRAIVRGAGAPPQAGHSAGGAALDLSGRCSAASRPGRGT
jgi:GT2 family glycosyltransferase